MNEWINEWMNVQNFGRHYVPVVRQTKAWIFTDIKNIEKINAAFEFVFYLRHLTNWGVQIGMSDKLLNDYLRSAGNSIGWTGGRREVTKLSANLTAGNEKSYFKTENDFEFQTWPLHAMWVRTHGRTPCRVLTIK